MPKSLIKIIAFALLLPQLCLGISRGQTICFAAESTTDCSSHRVVQTCAPHDHHHDCEGHHHAHEPTPEDDAQPDFHAIAHALNSPLHIDAPCCGCHIHIPTPDYAGINQPRTEPDHLFSITLMLPVAIIAIGVLPPHRVHGSPPPEHLRWQPQQRCLKSIRLII